MGVVPAAFEAVVPCLKRLDRKHLCMLHAFCKTSVLIDPFQSILNPFGRGSGHCPESFFKIKILYKGRYFYGNEKNSHGTR